MDYVRLMRPWQWYKNLMIFVPLVFAGGLFNQSLFLVTLAGFSVLCLVSSIGYVFNDLVDRKEDKHHPKKKSRPIASGKISAANALLFAFLLFIIAAFIAITYTNELFIYFAAALFFSTLSYSVYLKNVPIVDIHFIALNFIIRAVSGAVLIGVAISHWLFICVFLLALFWAIGKRDVELVKLGKEAAKHKPVFRFYTLELLRAMTNILCAALLLSYMLYASAISLMMMATIPFATFMIFRYLYFIYTNSEVVQSSERIFLDKQMAAALVIWVLISVIALY